MAVNQNSTKIGAHGLIASQTASAAVAALTQGTRKFSPAIPWLIALAMAVCSILCHHGGSLHYEVETRLPYYLSNSSLLDKLYDSDVLDGGMYQARELSYLFDYLDCRFIALCVKLGHPHFLSIVHYVFLTLISLVIWKFGVAELGLERWIVTGVLLLFWTSPIVFLSGGFFRTAKIGVSFCMAILYWLVFRLLTAETQRRQPIPKGSWLTCFAAAWAATLFDRQGVFLIATMLILLGFWFASHREKKVLNLLTAFAAALTLSFAYNYVIAPLITLSINDYWPDFKYQQLPWGGLAASPFFYMGGGLSLYLDTIRFFLGNIPQWTAALLLIVLTGLALATEAKHSGRKKGFASVAGLVVCLTGLTWIMIVLMFLRHPALARPEVRRTYYFLPTAPLLTMSLLLLLSRLKARGILQKVLLTLFLFGALTGNIIALPGHRAVLWNEANDKKTHLVLEALRNLKNPNYKVPRETELNPVFSFFHDGNISESLSKPKSGAMDDQN